jgi:2-polyprenyl-3-methyl-5-hydroxy-6-metoxy-1,4-benzoquinol methylase
MRMWKANLITDDWFRSHYCFAGGVVGDWLADAGFEFEGATILDFGCGDGITDLALAINRKPAQLIGVDLYEAYQHLPDMALRQLELPALPSNLSFKTIAPGDSVARWLQPDAIISWSTFEHVVRPVLKNVVADLFAALKPGGLFFAQIEPLYYSPFGSHLQRFTPQPWAHLLHSDAQMWQLIADHPLDFAADQQDVMARVRDADTIRNFLNQSYLELNKLTAQELVDLLRGAGFVIEKEVRNQVQGYDIPSELSYRHPADVLLTNEVVILARKPL